MTPADATRIAITATLANLRARGETGRCVEIRGVDYDDAYQFDPGEPSVVYGTLASPTLRADEGEIVLLTPAATAHVSKPKPIVSPPRPRPRPS